MLKDTTNNFVNDMRNAETEFMLYVAENGTFKELDVHGEALILRLMNLLHKSYEVVLEEAKAIDDINAKLDKLIEKK